MSDVKDIKGKINYHDEKIRRRVVEAYRAGGKEAVEAFLKKVEKESSGEKSENKERLKPERKREFNSKLFDAISKGNIDEIKYYLESGADPNANALNGWTPLHYAASYNDKEATKLILEYGGDVNARDVEGMTPLALAALENNTQVAELLIKNDANVNERNIKGDTPLLLAVKNRNKEMVELILSKGKNPSDLPTALKVAALNFDTENVKILSNYISNIVEKVAFYDVDYGSIPEPNLLWKVYHAYRKKGYYVYSSPHPEKIKVLDVIRLLADQPGIDINLSDETGNTLLTQAIIDGEYEIAKILIENGADVNVRHNIKYKFLYSIAKGKPSLYNVTPLMLACAKGQKELVELLIQKGAKVNAIDDFLENAYTFLIKARELSDIFSGFYQKIDDKTYKEIEEILKRHGAIDLDSNPLVRLALFPVRTAWYTAKSIYRYLRKKLE